MYVRMIYVVQGRADIKLQYHGDVVQTFQPDLYGVCLFAWCLTALSA